MDTMDRLELVLVMLGTLMVAVGLPASALKVLFAWLERDGRAVHGTLR